MYLGLGTEVWGRASRNSHRVQIYVEVLMTVVCGQVWRQLNSEQS
jgi:hypothetical protein